MQNNWLYFHIFDGDKQLLMCCIKENIIKEEDLAKLDTFLAYYKQNYKIRSSHFQEGIDHICDGVNCVRTHIIDMNVSKL